MTADNDAAVADALAESDPDRYVGALFAPAKVRPALIALYAFHHEAARIGAIVREPMAGHVRLAWWREQITAVYSGAAPEAPVPRALSQAVRTHSLPREPFDRYLDARACELEEAPFADETALAAHADAVEGCVVRLAVRVLGAGDRADGAAGHAALAVACGGHLRDLAFFAQHRRCRLPLRLLDEAGLNAEDVFRMRDMSPALRWVCDRLSATARMALWKLSYARYPSAATPALAVATLARWPTARNFDPLRPKAMPTWHRVAALALANLTWRY